jgi:hypothetical protein
MGVPESMILRRVRKDWNIAAVLLLADFSLCPDNGPVSLAGGKDLIALPSSHTIRSIGGLREVRSGHR